MPDPRHASPNLSGSLLRADMVDSETTEIGHCQSYTWELGYLGSIYPPCDVDWFFGRDEWQIKGQEAVVMTCGDDVMRFLRCTCERVTSVCVVYPGMFLILVIGLRDCVGGSLGRSDWQDRLSWWAGESGLCI